MEESEIGGIPIGVSALSQVLPLDKQRRETYVRKLALTLTFVTGNFFCALQEPLPVVQKKIVTKCNVDDFLLETNDSIVQWCKGTIVERDAGYMMANLLSLFLVILGISTYFSGVIADSFNPRYFLSAGCILSGFFAITLGLADRWRIQNYEYFTVQIVLFAVCQCTAWPIVLACTTHWYSGTRRGLFFGIWNINNYTGSLLGTYVTDLFIDSDWGWSFFVPGFLIIGAGFLNFLFLVVHPSELDELDKETKSIRDTEVELELPPWLDSNYGIEFTEALKVPGVIEFSACMFFSRITSYFLTEQLPSLKDQDEINITRSQGDLFYVPYAIGAILGGAIVGMAKDAFKRDSPICVFFLLVSILVIFLQVITWKVESKVTEVILYILLGLFVEAPYIFLSTSVAADLGTHSRIRRGVRGLPTVAGIIEATGILGSCMASVLNSYVIKVHWHYFLVLTAAQGLAAFCLTRMVLKEFKISISNSALLNRWRKD